MLLAVSAIVGAGMAALLFRLFFKDFREFVECLRFYFQPDIISLFRGELLEDWWKSTKLGVWFVLSLIMAFLTFCELPRLFPSLKPHYIVDARETEPEDAEVEVAENEQETVPSQTNQVALQTNSASAMAIQNDGARYASRYHVNVGDTVEISALKPAIALRRATITSMTGEQLTVKNGSDNFTVQWKDVTRLRNSDQPN